VGLQAGRAVFVCATYVHDYERHIRDILTRNSFSSAVLYTAMSDTAHGVQAVCGVCIERFVNRYRGRALSPE
jgi:hypothetical protein